MIPKKERIWVIIALVVAVLYGFWQLKGLLQLSSDFPGNRQFEHTARSFGSNARIVLFFVLAYYVLLRLIRIRSLGQFKKSLTPLLRFTKKWHTPVAIIAIVLILLHTIGFLMHGFRWNFNYITGILALLVLLPVPISGLFRYKRLDKKWHLRSGIAFAILFLIHSYL